MREHQITTFLLLQAITDYHLLTKWKFQTRPLLYSHHLSTLDVRQDFLKLCAVFKMSLIHTLHHSQVSISDTREVHASTGVNEMQINPTDCTFEAAAIQHTLYIP